MPIPRDSNDRTRNTEWWRNTMDLTKIWDGTSGPAVVDPKTNILVGIDSVHHEIHEGAHFEAHIETGDATVGDNVTLICAFKTTDTANKLHHIVIDFKSSGRVKMELLEGETWDTNTGAVVAVYDNNRDTANTSEIREDKTATPAWTAGGVLEDPTGLNADGVPLHTDYAYTAKQRGGNVAQGRHEWVLANDETYVIRLTALEANIYMGMVIHFYEHTNSN